MTVRELATQLKLEVCCGAAGLDKEIKGGYTSDLLSDVMGNAREGNIWITLQTHKNIMAIASLKELAAIVLVFRFHLNVSVFCLGTCRSDADREQSLLFLDKR